MKNSIIYCVVAMFLFIGASFMGNSNANAANFNRGDEKLPGAIVLGHIPPGCDCTIESSTCFCVVPGDNKELEHK